MGQQKSKDFRHCVFCGVPSDEEVLSFAHINRTRTHSISAICRRGIGESGFRDPYAKFSCFASSIENCWLLCSRCHRSYDRRRRGSIAPVKIVRRAVFAVNGGDCVVGGVFKLSWPSAESYLRDHGILTFLDEPSAPHCTTKRQPGRPRGVRSVVDSKK